MKLQKKLSYSQCLMRIINLVIEVDNIPISNADTLLTCNNNGR